MAGRRTSQRILLVIGAAIGALILAAIVLAIRPPEMLDPSTPEGTAQRYYQAIDSGDTEVALSYLAEDLAERCDDSEMYYQFRDREDVGISVVILDVEVGENDARVDVSVTENYGREPFSSGSYRHDETLEMERSDGRWLIRGIPWPWDPYVCNERN